AGRYVVCRIVRGELSVQELQGKVKGYLGGGPRRRRFATSTIKALSAPPARPSYARLARAETSVQELQGKVKGYLGGGPRRRRFATSTIKALSAPPARPSYARLARAETSVQELQGRVKGYLGGGPEGKLRGRPPPLGEPRSGPWRRRGSESGAGRAQTRHGEYDERTHTRRQHVAKFRTQRAVATSVNGDARRPSSPAARM